MNKSDTDTDDEYRSLSASSDDDSDYSSSSFSSCEIASEFCDEIVSNSKVRSVKQADEDANDSLLVQLRSVTEELSKKGTDQNRHAISILAQAVCSPDIIENNLVAATMRLTGLKRNTVIDACTSNAARTQGNMSNMPSISQQNSKRRRRSTVRDEAFYYELIHESCPLVELVKHSRSLYIFLSVLLSYLCLGSIEENAVERKEGEDWSKQFGAQFNLHASHTVRYFICKYCVSNHHIH